MRLGLISDIHGNIWALEAALEALHQRGVDSVLNLGDVLYGPLAPAQTAECLMDLGIPTLRGNHDRELMAPPARPLVAYTVSQLSTAQLAWVASWPFSLAGEDWFAFHATPADDEVYLTESPTPQGLMLRQPTEIAALLGKTPDASLMLCGHSHVPRLLCLPDGRTIVNPGSVGQPAYTDDVPFPYALQQGGPQARCAIVERTAHGWQAEFLAVAYPWHEAVQAALRAGFPNWARWLGGWAFDEARA